MKKVYISFLLLISTLQLHAQVDDSQLGGWYMYFWNKDFKNSRWGLQGDYQFRNWNIIGDQEQLLLRSGVTFRPKDTNIKFIGGYAFINTGAFGEGKSVSIENRIYQELLMPHKVGERFYFTHRYRFEQRFVRDQNFRTRWRYNIFLNVPLNNTSFDAKTVYLALYNELFVNGKRDIGNGRTVELLDRNRTYGAFGYVFSSKLRTQFGMMRQATANWQKYQLQLSLHHNL